MSSPEHITAMFPLETVLFPTMTLPLRLFEDRYRQLARDCLSGNREFGVCLIERGQEVGGGEVRSSFGTMAEIIHAEELPDGEWMLLTIGTYRIRILEWLEDKPYPRALTQDWRDFTEEDLSHQRELALQHLKIVLGLLVDEDHPATARATDIDEDPVVASYQMAILSPFSAFDRQRLLGASTARVRLETLIFLLQATEADIRVQRDKN